MTRYEELLLYLVRFHYHQHKQQAVSIRRLSAPSYHLLAKINAMEHSSLSDLSVYIQNGQHFGNHRCIIEKNVPIVFILPSRWQDGAESLGIETTSCLCN